MALASGCAATSLDERPAEAGTALVVEHREMCGISVAALFVEKPPAPSFAKERRTI
jgi:hypothetical protein